MIPEKPYRVCYRKNINKPYQYSYFSQSGEAHKFWRNKKHSGYIGCFQFWNYQERIWIG